MEGASCGGFRGTGAVREAAEASVRGSPREAL